MSPTCVDVGRRSCSLSDGPKVSGGGSRETGRFTINSSHTKRKSAATETEDPFACSRHVCATQTAAHRPTDRAHTQTDRHTHNTTHKFPLSNTAQTTYLLDLLVVRVGDE